MKRYFVPVFPLLILVFASILAPLKVIAQYQGGSINTAVGLIPVNSTEEFLSFVIPWAVGVGGGIAFILMIFAGFMIMTSAGNPQRTQAGKELLTAAISGLILIIFSVFILRVIGVDIFELPEF
jgi:hypothetical protein